MSELSGKAARPPEPGSAQDTAATGSGRLAGQQALATGRWPGMLERVGRFVGASGSALAIIGFALPIGSGWYQGQMTRSAKAGGL